MSHSQRHLLLVIEVTTNFENLLRIAAIFFFHAACFSNIYTTTQYFRLLNQVAPASSGLGRHNNSDVSINVCAAGVGI